MLGIFPATTLADGGTSRRAQLLETVSAVLVLGADPDDRSGALGGLLSATGALPAFDPEIPWTGAVYTRAKELQNGEWGAAAAGDAVARTTAATLTANVFVTIAFPTSDGG